MSHDSIPAAIIEYVTQDVAESPDESHWPRPRRRGPWTYAQLLRRHGLTEADEQEMPQQVKASPSGPWCKPAVGRASTECGKALAGYSLRDESYLGEICRDGCYGPYVLAVLVPKAITDEAERVKREQAAEDARETARHARWQRESTDRIKRSELLAAERHQRDEEEKARRTSGGMVPLKKPDVIDD